MRLRHSILIERIDEKIDMTVTGSRDDDPNNQPAKALAANRNATTQVPLFS